MHIVVVVLSALFLYAPAAFGQLSVDVAKVTCVELGFKLNTESFGRCVLQLSKVEDKKTVRQTQLPENIAVEPVRPSPQQTNTSTQTSPVNSTYLLPPCKGPVPEWNACVGTMVFRSGERYEGEFLNGKFHGYGVYTRADGLIYHRGPWVEDRPVIH